jgi:MFS superfamily sulfate permease-like transporter
MAGWAAAVPSGLAYAGLAGLPPIVGLYASAVAGLAFGLAGSIRQTQVGPTSTSSILKRPAVLGKVPGGKRHREVHRHPEAKTREGVLIVRFEAPIVLGNAH